MSSFAKISIRIAADLKQFSSQMQNAQRSMEQVGKKLAGIGAGLTVGITLPILGIGAAAIKAASDAEETASKFDTVFRDVSKAAQESADTLRNAYGLSSNASKQLLGDTGDLLTGFGFSQKAALDLSTEVNKLAVDLASFTNFSGGTEGASKALTKALLGEREGVKSLGISILEADVKTRVLTNTQKGLTFESERQAKAFATLQLAQEQSKNAIGDYARTNQSFANQMRLVKARIEDVSVQFGEILLPYVTALAGKIGKLVEGFSNLSPSTKKIIVIVAGLAAAIGPVLAAVGTFIIILPTLSAAFIALTGPIGLVIAAIAAIAFVVYKNWDRIKKEMRDLQNYFIDLYNESEDFRFAVESLILTFKTVWNIVKLVLDAIVTGFKTAANFILDSFKNVGAVIKAVFTRDFAAIPGILKKQAVLGASSFTQLFDGLGKDISTFSNNMKTDIGDALDAVTSKKKIAFVEENVDADAIQNVVANAVTEGLKGTGKGKLTKLQKLEMELETDILKRDLAELEQLIIDTGGKLDLEKQAAGLEAYDGKLQDIYNSFLQFEDLPNPFTQLELNAIEFNKNFTAIMQDAVASFATGFGELIGTAAQGGLSLDGIGRLILGTIANMAIQVGQMAIGIGLAVEGIKKALQSLAGPVAIAAGIALVALGTLAKSSLSGAASGGGGRTAFAKGGIVYGPTNALIGEYSGAKNNPEVVAPLNKLKGMIADVVGDGGGNLSGEFTVRGKDLVYVLGQADQYYKRRG